MSKYGGNGKERKFGDLYETPVAVTRALLDKLRLPPSMIWEPFAGRGKVSRVLEAAGHKVVSSDIIQRDYELDVIGDYEPLLEDIGRNVDHVISNPPYGPRNSEVPRIVKNLLSVRKRHGVIALLLPSELDFGKSKDRVAVFRDCPNFRGLIRIQDRIKWFEETMGTGTENHCWAIWGPSDWVWDRSRHMPVIDYVRART